MSVDAYFVYCICRSFQGRNKPSRESFENSHEFGYYNMLADHFKHVHSFDDKKTKDFIRAIYNKDSSTFDPYNLMSDEANDCYIEWKKNNSTKSAYISQVVAGIEFIENFCIKNKIDFEYYCNKYALTHIRERRYDWSIPVFTKMIDIHKMKQVDKLLLKSFITKYNIIERRLSDCELHSVLESRIAEMKEVISRMLTTSQVNQVPITN